MINKRPKSTTRTNILCIQLWLTECVFYNQSVKMPLLITSNSVTAIMYAQITNKKKCKSPHYEIVECTFWYWFMMENRIDTAQIPHSNVSYQKRRRCVISELGICTRAQILIVWFQMVDKLTLIFLLSASVENSCGRPNLAQAMNIELRVFFIH